MGATWGLWLCSNVVRACMFDVVLLSTGCCWRYSCRSVGYASTPHQEPNDMPKVLANELVPTIVEGSCGYYATSDRGVQSFRPTLHCLGNISLLNVHHLVTSIVILLSVLLSCVVVIPDVTTLETQWDTIHNKIGSYIVSLLEKALTKHVVLLELELPCNERLLLLPLDDGAQVPRLSLNLCVNRLQRIL